MSFPYYTEFGVHYPTPVEVKDASERVVDPKKKLSPGCTAKCNRWVNEYAACCERLKGRTDNRGNCSGQYEELHTCIDRCVAKDLFRYLK